MFSATCSGVIKIMNKNSNLIFCSKNRQYREETGNLKKIAAAQNLSAGLSTESVDALEVAPVVPFVQPMRKNHVAF
jgi:hypothetical protein